MLQEIDQALVRLLRQELEAEGVAREVEVAVGVPSAERPDAPRLNLFLHDVAENLALRDQSFEVRPTADLWTVGKSRRATRVDASYLLTAHATEAAAEHGLLGAALRILLRHGFVPPPLLGESLRPFGDEALTLMIAQRDGWAHRDVAALWQAAGIPLRPAIGIVATAMIDPFETKTVRLVREAVFGLAQGVHPQGADRPMDLRSLRVSAAGRVVDDATGRPVEAELAVDGATMGRTDPDGVFLARDLMPGRRALRLAASGYLPWEGEVDAPAPLRGGPLEPMEVRLRREGGAPKAKPLQAEGVLRYADGRPAAYVPVSVGGRTTVTDAEGRYTFDLAPSEKPETLLPKGANLPS